LFSYIDFLKREFKKSIYGKELATTKMEIKSDFCKEAYSVNLKHISL